MLLNNKWFVNDIKEEIKNYLETNENEHTTPQNLLDTAKALLRGNFIALQAYLRKIEKFQSNPTPKKTPRRTTTKPRVSRRKEVIKIRAEINNTETKK